MAERKRSLSGCSIISLPADAASKHENVKAVLLEDSPAQCSRATREGFRIAVELRFGLEWILLKHLLLCIVFNVTDALAINR